MKFLASSAAVLAAIQGTAAFVPRLSAPRLSRSLLASTTEDKQSTKPSIGEKDEKLPFFMGSTDPEPPEDDDEKGEGLPWWWEMVWDLDIMKLGTPGKEIIFGDSANVLRTNIEQIYGDYPSLDGCPLAEGALDDIGDGTMFIGLQNYYQQNGSPYKLCFGPKSFLVISDPVQARHILRDANTKYDKGVLAEILEPIMGKGRSLFESLELFLFECI
jgi:hypothetical protein